MAELAKANLPEAWGLPTATTADGIHISAALRVNAMQLHAHKIHWAAQCMEQAANHIDALEDLLHKRPKPETPTPEGGAPCSETSPRTT
jgi:hypothetical protein